MKKIIFFVSILFAFQLNARLNYNKDSILASIESRINLPVFPDFTVDITTYRAKGDGETKCKSTFDKAIKICAKNKGETIILPKGNYKINVPIHFQVT